MYGPMSSGVIAIIVLAGCATVIMKHYFRARAREAETGRDGRVSRAEFEASKNKMAKMEERLRVLERIVTSQRDRLARELSELED